MNGPNLSYLVRLGDQPSYQPGDQPSYQPGVQPSYQPDVQPSYQPALITNSSAEFRLDSCPFIFLGLSQKAVVIKKMLENINKI